MIHAVIFDFDGTLADSYAAITASVNHVRALRHLPPLAEAEVRYHVGRGLPYLLQHCVPGADLDEDAQRYRAHHPSVMESGTRLLPGASYTLAELHGRGLKIAICSNKPRSFTRILVRALNIADNVDAVFGPEDVPRPKPAPDMLQAALRQFSVAPDQALYVGDMTVDIQTARGAGVRVWVFPTGSDTREALVAASPDLILDQLGEIPARIAAIK